VIGGDPVIIVIAHVFEGIVPTFLGQDLSNPVRGIHTYRNTFRSFFAGKAK
jgi:hypothetical protein